MDYKQKYSEIPKGYKHEVLKLSNSHKSDMYFLLNGTKGKVGEDKALRIYNAINQIWKPHNLAKMITVTLKRNIVIDGIIHIDYTDLMEFQIEITGTIGSHGTKFELVNSAREEYENLNLKKPYILKLLIAKKIIYDQRDDN